MQLEEKIKELTIELDTIITVLRNNNNSRIKI